MGLIADLDFPHVFPQVEGRASRVPNVPRSGTRGTSEIRETCGARPSIVRDTPLVPRAAAEAVFEEACQWVGEELPREWIPRLIERAETIYERPGGFRRRLRGAGNTGREWLWAFMRHWLAALVLEHRPTCYARLPVRYAVGASPVTK